MKSRRPSLQQSIAVTCQNVQKTFGKGSSQTFALRQVSLEVYEGEFMMLVGPSGCGKTTLISAIAGILRPDDGTCSVLGHNMQGMNPEELLTFRGKNIGFIFQSFNLIPTLTVLENTAVPLLINQVPRAQALAQAEHMLWQTGIGDRAQSMPMLLSGGQQQRVAIARALVHKPRLVICDEPTSALDHHTGLHIIELMKDINKRIRTTFIIVTHDGRIFDYADRMAHMDDGYIKKVTHFREEHP